MSVGRAKRAKPPRSRGTSGASDGRKSVGDDFGLFDHDVFDGNVAVEAAGRGADLGDFVDDVFTGHDAAEDGREAMRVMKEEGLEPSKLTLQPECL